MRKADTVDILDFKIMQFMMMAGPESVTMAQMGKKLGEQRYTVTRAIDRLEKQGLAQRGVRAPRLTDAGLMRAKEQNDRYMIALNHLMYEGVDLENAQHDAYCLALYCSDEMMDVLRSSDARNCVKLELKDREKFDGNTLCEKLKNGTFYFPFIIYRLHAKGNNNISMANEGFENPCAIFVDEGKGFVQLKIKPMVQTSHLNGFSVKGQVSRLEYMDGEQFIPAEFHNDVVSFPASCMNFMNMGEGMGQIMQGTVCLRMQCSCGIVHMPESEALFTIMI